MGVIRFCTIALLVAAPALLRAVPLPANAHGIFCSFNYKPTYSRVDAAMGYMETDFSASHHGGRFVMQGAGENPAYESRDYAIGEDVDMCEIASQAVPRRSAEFYGHCSMSTVDRQLAGRSDCPPRPELAGPAEAPAAAPAPVVRAAVHRPMLDTMVVPAPAPAAAAAAAPDLIVRNGRSREHPMRIFTQAPGRENQFQPELTGNQERGMQVRAGESTFLVGSSGSCMVELKRNPEGRVVVSFSDRPDVPVRL